MKKCKITVMKITRYTDLMEKYENPIAHACDLHEGQTFIANGWQRPDGLCESAWESMSLAEKVTDFVRPYTKKAKIAVMGCVVNGPGEAKDADLGIAGGNGYCLIFSKGEPYKKVTVDCAEEEFFKEIRKLLDE